MKKVILSAAAIVAIAFSAKAQETTEGGAGFKSGDMFISGAIGFGSEKEGDNKVTQFELSPKAAYFVTNNIAVGLQIGFTSRKAEDSNGITTTETKTNTFGAGAFGRYYLTPANRFSFFGQVGLGFTTSKTEYDTPGTPEDKDNGFNIGVAPGISYFVSDNLALEATFGILGYNTTKPDFDGAESTDQFNIGLNMSDINFGIVYKF